MLAQRVDRLLVRADEVGRDPPRVICGEHALAPCVYARQLPMDLHLRRPPGREDQIADFARGTQHRREQGCGRDRAQAGRAPSKLKPIAEKFLAPP